MAPSPTNDGSAAPHTAISMDLRGGKAGNKCPPSPREGVGGGKGGGAGPASASSANDRELMLSGSPEDNVPEGNSSAAASRDP